MKPTHLAIALVWLAALLAAFRTTSAHTVEMARRDDHLTDPAPLASLDPRAIDVVTLGHRGLFEDVGYLWTIQMLANPEIAKADPAAVISAVDLTVRQEPPIHSLYMISCMVIGLNLKRPDACEPIMLHGMKAVPNNFLLPATVGFMTAFRMNDAQKGALYYRIAGSKPGAPPYMTSLADRLATDGVPPPDAAQAAFESLFQGEKGLGDFLLKKAAQQAPPAPETAPPPTPQATPPPAEPAP